MRVFSQADKVEMPTVSSPDSASTTSACVSFTSGNPEWRSSRNRRASEAAAPGGVIGSTNVASRDRNSLKEMLPDQFFSAAQLAGPALA